VGLKHDAEFPVLIAIRPKAVFVGPKHYSDYNE
jgi:hypothetical protein